MCVWVVNATLRPLFPPSGTENRYSFTGVWLGSGIGVDGCGESRPYPPDSPARSAAIPTELSKPTPADDVTYNYVAV